MDDDALAARLAIDLDETFESVVRAHQDRIFTIALRIVGDPRDAEEVAQDAFVRAYRAISSYEPERVRALRLRAWLAAIVANLARNRATRRRQVPSIALDEPRGMSGPTPADLLASPDEASNPYEAIDRDERARHWAALLAGLPDRYRIPVVLRHVDGLSFAEMSAALERPEGTLKAQVHRGLALLRSAHLAAVAGDPDSEPAARRLQPQEMTA